MFVCKVSMHLKADGAGGIIRKMEDEIIPLLRKQQGFLDALTLLSQSGKEAYAYSFWENSADAQTYEKTVFPKIAGFLAGAIDGAVRSRTYTVAHSTFHRLAAAAAS